MKLFKNKRVLQLLKYLKKLYHIYSYSVNHYTSFVGSTVILVELLKIREITEVSLLGILKFSLCVWIFYEIFNFLIKKVKQICSSV